MRKRKRAAGFSVGQHVVYPAHGVGKITAIETQDIAGTELQLFVIYIEKEKLTLSVPTLKAKESGLRPLASSELVAKAIAILKGRPRIKRSMWSRRAQEYDQKINSGDIILIAEVVRDLYRNDEQREQSYSERQLYESAIDRFSREVAAVEKINQIDAKERVLAVLSARGRQAARA